MHHCPRQPSKASWVLVDERFVHAEICKGRCFDCMWAWMHGCMHSKRTHKKQREYMHTTGSSQYACSMWQEPYRKCVCVCVFWVRLKARGMIIWAQTLMRARQHSPKTQTTAGQKEPSGSSWAVDLKWKHY